MFSRFLTPAFLLLCACVALPVQAERKDHKPATKRKVEGAKIKQKPLEMWAVLGNIAQGNNFDAPSAALWEVVQQFPQMHRFRVVWSMEVGPLKSQSTAHYNRALNTLSFFSKTQVGASTTTEKWSFSKVTPAMLARLAQKHEGAQSGDNTGFFGDLKGLGGKRE